MDTALLYESINILKKLYDRLFAESENIPYLVKFSDDLNKTHKEIRPDLIKDIEENNKDNNENGRIVLPHLVDEPIIILLNELRIKENLNEKSIAWYETFAHELTHVIDYCQMARMEKLSNYSQLEVFGKYSMFQLWSEYNARKKGYYFLSSILTEERSFSNTNDRVDYILESEWPFYLKQYYKDYFTSNGDGMNQIYHTMQFLGRYSVWCDLYPDTFHYSMFSSYFKSEKWIIHLFLFLREHELLSSVYQDFDEMDIIIREHWEIQ